MIGSIGFKQLWINQENWTITSCLKKIETMRSKNDKRDDMSQFRTTNFEDFSCREMRGSREGFSPRGIRETVLMIRPKVRHLLDYFVGQRWQDCNQ